MMNKFSLIEQIAFYLGHASALIRHGEAVDLVLYQIYSALRGHLLACDVLDENGKFVDKQAMKEAGLVEDASSPGVKAETDE